MNSFQRPNSRQMDVATTTATFMSRVYFWMMAGLVLSGLVAYALATDPQRVINLVNNKLLFFGIIILQFGAVIVLSTLINSMSIMLTTSLYLGYAILSGVTASIIFLVYSAASISQAFFLTAFSFLGLSMFGYMTKRDLGPIGTFCMMGLFGLIGIMFISFFVSSMQTGTFSMVVNVCAIIIFAGLTAYDTQKIKNYNGGLVTSEQAKKAAISGALMLYLDFINLFLSILRLTGDRR
jgi:uncharacterized protein